MIVGRSARAIYCSDNCKKVRDNLARKIIQKEKRCMVCNKTMVPTRVTKKFCSSKCKDTNKIKKMSKWDRIEKYYGLTEHQWKNLLSSQGGVCAICKKKSNIWHTDHDHSCCPPNRYTCGKCVRGILCNRCNQAIGLLSEDISSFARAVEYLS